MGPLSSLSSQANSALQLSGVAKSSTSFGWGKGGKVTSAGWQVTLCDLIWHVISRSGVVYELLYPVYFFYFYGPRGSVGAVVRYFLSANTPIHTYVPIRVRHDVNLRFTKCSLTCTCQNAWRPEGHVHCTKIIRLHSWATQLKRLKFNPSVPPSPSLWIQTLEQTYFVYCVALVRRPISNANS